MRLLMLLMGLAIALAATAARGESVIELRSVARLPAGSAVTLGDVAVLTGAASPLGSLVLAEAGDGRTTVTLAEVRQAIRESGTLSRSGVVVRGSSCRIVRLAPLATEQPVEADEKPAELPSAAPGTVRWHIERTLLRVLGVPMDRLKLTWDQRDHEFLESNTLGRSVLARPIGNSQQMPVSITVYEQDRLIERRVLRVEVLILRETAVAATALSRGSVLEADRLRSESRWVGPGEPTVAFGEAVGMVLRSPVSAGEVISQRVVEPPIVIERGQIVEVHCVSGTIVIVEQARAMRDAVVGEVIRFESIDGRRRTFDARVDGPGIAMLAGVGSGEAP